MRAKETECESFSSLSLSLDETSSFRFAKTFEGKILVSEILEKLFSDDSGAGVERDLHLGYLLVDLLHEVNHEIHQFVLVHLEKGEKTFAITR